MFENLFQSRLGRNFIEHGYKITSSLPLQMCLYFNVLFFPFWFVFTVTMLYMKFHCLTSIHQFIIILIMVCLTVVEIVRLYLGYQGNLSEKVTELAGFWVLSVVLQLPLHCFSIFSPPIWPSVGELAVEGIMLCFLILEVLSGFFALRKSAAHQARQFHVNNLHNQQRFSSKLLVDTVAVIDSLATVHTRQKDD